LWRVVAGGFGKEEKDEGFRERESWGRIEKGSGVGKGRKSLTLVREAVGRERSRLGRREK